MLANTNAPIVFVHVGWLNGHQPMPAGVAQQLNSAGITPDKYPDILARDPLAVGNLSPAPPRFAPINTTFPYEPPYAPSDPVTTSSYSISNERIEASGTAASDSLKVGVSISASADFLSLATAKLKSTTNWEWSNTSSVTHSASASETAQLTIGGPAYNYAGPSVIEVYYDTVYRTFAFAFKDMSTSNVALSGQLLTAAGKPNARQQITLTESGKKHVTYTDSKGEFAFFGKFTGPAKVQTHELSQTIPLIQSTKSIVLHP